MKKLEWNAYIYDSNKNKIKSINTLDNPYLIEDIKKSLKKINDKNEFSEKLRRLIFYYYGSKYEYETIISSFPIRIDDDELNRLISYNNKYFQENGNKLSRFLINSLCEKKIDVYEQIMLNYDKFVNYIWNEVNKNG